MAKVNLFDKENASGFFDVLEKVVYENTIDSLKILNVDESGFSIVQKRAGKVLDKKGNIRSVHCPVEKEESTLLLFTVLAPREYLSPLIIFKRQRNNPSLRVCAPPGSLLEVSESGYINL
jgi:hypothetical protein